MNQLNQYLGHAHLLRQPDASVCSVCADTRIEVVCSAAEVSDQLTYLEDFHRRRLRPTCSRSDLLDRSDFTQDGATDILCCRSCGHVFRRDQPAPESAANTYARDRYGTDRLEALYAAQVELFRPRAARLATLTTAAEPLVVVEIGSFVGGFLTAARERGWRAIGIDPGHEVGAFCRAKGLPVLEKAADDATLAECSAEVVAIWNTFDQLPDPGATLGEARRWLRPNGILALRVPSGPCFRECMRRLHCWSGVAQHFLRVAMAWNNLLGFPYLHGYSLDTLDLLLRDFGLRRIDAKGSVLPCLADANTKRWAAHEEQLVKFPWHTLSRFDRGMAPWFDAYYRTVAPTERVDVSLRRVDSVQDLPSQGLTPL